MEKSARVDIGKLTNAEHVLQKSRTHVLLLIMLTYMLLIMFPTAYSLLAVYVSTELPRAKPFCLRGALCPPSTFCSAQCSICDPSPKLMNHGPPMPPICFFQSFMLVLSCVKLGEIFFHTEGVIILDSLLLRLPRVCLISTQQAYESVLI